MPKFGVLLCGAAFLLAPIAAYAGAATPTGQGADVSVSQSSGSAGVDISGSTGSSGTSGSGSITSGGADQSGGGTPPGR